MQQQQQAQPFEPVRAPVPASMATSPDNVLPPPLMASDSVASLASPVDHMSATVKPPPSHTISLFHVNLLPTPVEPSALPKPLVAATPSATVRHKRKSAVAAKAPQDAASFHVAFGPSLTSSSSSSSSSTLKTTFSFRMQRRHERIMTGVMPVLVDEAPDLPPVRRRGRGRRFVMPRVVFDEDTTVDVVGLGPGEQTGAANSNAGFDMPKLPSISPSAAASQLTAEEFKVCQSIRVQPEQFLHAKIQLKAAFDKNGFFHKTAARKYVKGIDVNRLGKLWEYFVRTGILYAKAPPPSHFY